MTDAEADWLATHFEQRRPRLHAVAYRMLGSLTEADDAVQETWIRLSRSEVGAIDNLDAWLTTVVGRVCLNLLRSRRTVHENPGWNYVPDPLVGPADDGTDNPEEHVLLADAVGLALLVVLETLSPTERVAFVLHDMFAVPFDEIAPMIECTPAATRQLASRARRRVAGAGAVVGDHDLDLPAQRQIVEAFLRAARQGDFEGLLTLLDPDVVLRADAGAGRGSLLEGVEAVVPPVMHFMRLAQTERHLVVNGSAGLQPMRDGSPMAVMSFTFRGGTITHITALADPDRLHQLGLDVVNG
ncbi:MAG TPA: sigma-70 family RNA polymerase sigma factor [Acidimicrobiales bacterium]|jgi:RNA polymerase sigma-70 factor (ECF subfamily)